MKPTFELVESAHLTHDCQMRRAMVFLKWSQKFLLRSFPNRIE